MKKRILIIRTDRVGDVVMITPMIRELRRTYPDSFITTLTNPNSAEVLLNNPHLDEILTDDGSTQDFGKVIRVIRSMKFTDGLLVMPTERAAYQMFFGRVKNRIGVGRKPYSLITLMKSVSRTRYIPLRHEADYCMDLARAIGVKSDNLQPEIFVTADEIEEGRILLRDAGCDASARKYIIHTGSGGSSRNWSEEKYLMLTGEILKRREQAEVILTAKEMSADFIRKTKGLGGSRVKVVKDSVRRLRDLIKIIANADALVAASTGPLHISAAMGIRTVGLYCHRPMNCAKHWGAIGPHAVNLEASKEYCDANCSSDKEVCNFEEGIPAEQVLEHL